MPFTSQEASWRLMAFWMTWLPLGRGLGLERGMEREGIAFWMTWTDWLGLGLGLGLGLDDLDRLRDFRELIGQQPVELVETPPGAAPG